jgi:dCMP deaminase
MDRRDKHDTFFDMLDQLKYRSTCLRGQTAAMVVRDGRIVSMGYNGAPPGVTECIEEGFCRTDNGLPLKKIGSMWVVEDPSIPPNEPQMLSQEVGCGRSVHAEANAIAFAARQGISTENTEMYCLSSPCHKCAQLIVSCGIVRVRFLREYRVEAGQGWFSQAGVELIDHGY